MTTTIRGAALLLGLALACLPLAGGEGAAPAEPQVIRVCRTGSSSFSYELFEQAKAIGEESGRFKIVSGKGDGLGFTRLDEMVRNPGTYEAFAAQRIDTLTNGKYDYLIIQTLGWVGLSPTEQMDLCGRILPDLTRRMKAKGTQVILYDRYIGSDGGPSKWSGSYPEGQKLNYLLHIYAAKMSGFDKISFGGEAVNALRYNPAFKDARVLYDAGHPGVFTNYMSAVNLAFLLTGEDPVGNPVRNLPMQGFEVDFFKKHGAGNPFADRVHGDLFTLTDAEASLIQDTAMASQRTWSALLRKCLTDEQAWQEVVAEITRIQGEYKQYAKHGLDPKVIARKEAADAPSTHEGLNAGTVNTLRWKGRSVNHCGMSIRYFLSDHMPGGSKETQRLCNAYWLETNSKFLEDVLLGADVYRTQCGLKGEREEVKRMGGICWGYKQILAVSVVRNILSRVDGEREQLFFEKIGNSGMGPSCSPTLAAYEKQHKGDKAKLIAGWDAYLAVWRDPNLLDKATADHYAQATAVFAEADQLFKESLAAAQGAP